MITLEDVKENVEAVTGLWRPSKAQARAAIRKAAPQTFLFADDGKTPNNSRLPLIVYRRAVTFDKKLDPAAVLEEVFAARGWGDSWRDGIYGYSHFHSRTHEVLGIARGRVRVRFGGPKGKDIDLAVGDVVVLPAGTGHRKVTGSDDLLVVGAYPPEGTYDERRGKAAEHRSVLRAIKGVKLPQADPVYGRRGPGLKLWKTLSAPAK